MSTTNTTYNKPTNLFCSHWFKPKADRSMKCPCPLRWAKAKTKETEIVDIEPPEIDPVLIQDDRWEQVILIRQQASTNWESLTRKLLKILFKRRLAGLHLSHMKNYAWMTRATKKKLLWRHTKKACPCFILENSKNMNTLLCSKSYVTHSEPTLNLLTPLWTHVLPLRPAKGR